MSGQRVLFSNEQVVRLAVTVFLIGGAWARLEYKMDEMNTATKTILEKYVISNDKDKEIFVMKLESVKAQMEVNTMTIKAITEFIKPDDIKRKNYK